MKKLFIIALFLTGCVEKIDVGNVGLKVNLAGSTRGVEDSPTVSGWVGYNPFTEEVVEFPTTVQNVTYEGEHSINFASTEGLAVKAPVSFSYHVEADRAPHLYAKFKQKDLGNFAHTYLQRLVRDSLNEQAAAMPIREIYGSGKTRLLNMAKDHLNRVLTPDGVSVDQLTFNGPLELPPQVQAAINAATTQTEQAVAAENRVRQIEAEAKQKAAQAEGEAAARMAIAKADADSTLIRAEAEAKANELISRSLTNNIIEARRVAKWDGKLPMIGSGSNTIIDARSLTAVGN